MTKKSGLGRLGGYCGDGDSGGGGNVQV